MVRDHVGHHETRVIIHEADEVDPLVLAQEEREDVRLPHLVRTRPLESPRRLLFPRPRRRRGRHQPRLVKDLPNLRLAHADRFEPSEQVPDPARPRLGVRTLCILDCLLHRRRRLRRRPDVRVETLLAFRLVPQQPILHRRRPQPEHLRSAVDSLAALHDHAHDAQLELERI